jgi:hypothetical protein
MTGVQLREQNPSHLVVVHAGVYPGITSIRYTTTGYNNPDTRDYLLKNDLYFYAVKRGQ